MPQSTAIELHLPPEIAAAMRARDRGSRSDEEGIRVRLAVALFAEGAISLGKAAALAAMNQYEFALYLKRMGLPAFDYTCSDYEEDKEFASSLSHG